MQINKRPQVIRDLIELATYLAEDSLDVSENFLFSAEKTFYSTKTKHPLFLLF